MNQKVVVLTGIQYHFDPGVETGAADRPSLTCPRALPQTPAYPKTTIQLSNTISFLAVPSPAVSGRFRPYSYVFQSIGPVRCRGTRLNTASLTGKWYPQIPVDHISPQINQRVVNTTLIPVNGEHCAPPATTKPNARPIKQHRAI